MKDKYIMAMLLGTQDRVKANTHIYRFTRKQATLPIFPAFKGRT